MDGTEAFADRRDESDRLLQRPEQAGGAADAVQMRPRAPDAVRRRHAKGRLAHGVNCVVFATGLTVLIASQASILTDPQLGSLLAVVTAVAVVPGLALAVVNAPAVKAGRALGDPRAAASAAGGLALGLLVVTAALAVVSSGADTRAFALVAAMVPGIEVAVAARTVRAVATAPADAQRPGTDLESAGRRRP